MSSKGLHIVLVGFMGSGKSTIGRLLAKQLDRPFVDMDEEIAQQEQKSITEIFSIKGEGYFRKIEHEMLRRVLQSEVSSIISTGGGAPCFLDGMKFIRKHGYAFYLKVGRDTLLQRIAGDASRPLVKNKTKRELKQFIDETLRKRETYYKRANQTIAAYDQPEKIASRIIKHLDKKKT